MLNEANRETNKGKTERGDAQLKTQCLGEPRNLSKSTFKKGTGILAENQANNLMMGTNGPPKCPHPNPLGLAQVSPSWGRGSAAVSSDLAPSTRWIQGAHTPLEVGGLPLRILGRGPGTGGALSGARAMQRTLWAGDEPARWSAARGLCPTTASG